MPEAGEPKPRVIYKTIHADLRHGEGWPRPPRWGKLSSWTGWLTHREFDVLEYNARYREPSIYNIGKAFGIKHTAGNRMFYNMQESGLIDGLPEEFYPTPMGKILFDMTDQFLLEVDCE